MDLHAAVQLALSLGFASAGVVKLVLLQRRKADAERWEVSDRMLVVTGVLEILGASLWWVPPLALPVGIGFATLLLAAISVQLRVGNHWETLHPAGFLLALLAWFWTLTP